MFLKRLIKPTLLRRQYSGPPPFALAHKDYEAVEELFRKYDLHNLKSKEKIDELVRSGVISEHIGEQLNSDLKTQEEAGSIGLWKKTTFFLTKIPLETAEYWRKVFLFVGLPIIGIVGYNAYLLEMEHFEHLEHEPPNQIPYSYLKIRTKVISLLPVANILRWIEIFLWGWWQNYVSQRQLQPLIGASNKYAKFNNNCTPLCAMRTPYNYLQSAAIAFF